MRKFIENMEKNNYEYINKHSKFEKSHLDFKLSFKWYFLRKYKK